MTPTNGTLPPTILQPGRNCWTIQPVDQAGLLVDADRYYHAFMQAARQAQRYILIAGWRFNSDIRLLRGQEAAQNGGEVNFLPFLDGLCREKPDLHIYVLAWDFSVNYALEWEWFQEWKFQRGRHHRLWFRFDDQHAIGGSHHQKFAVVDGHLAFIGGLDFNADNWDDRVHRAEQPDRCDCGQPPHKPYHDMQAYVTGAAARETAAYFQSRWQAVTGTPLELPAPQGQAPRIKPSVPIRAKHAALSRSHPKTLTDPTEEQHVKPLFLDAIDAAEELIYVENQYFTSQAVFAAFQRRLRATQRPRLEIVMVLPKQLHSWVEAVAMEGPRLTLLDTLRKEAQQHGHHLGLYYSRAGTGAEGKEVNVLIHSKLLLVDDRFLTVGSANFSNRSLGLDTELNVSWEAGPRDTALRRSLRRVRVNLLAEHCGWPHGTRGRAGLSRRRGLVAYLDRIASSKKSRLRLLTQEAIAEDREWVEQMAKWGFSFDPGEPVLEETLHEPLDLEPTGLLSQGWRWFREWLRAAPTEQTPPRDLATTTRS